MHVEFVVSSYNENQKPLSWTCYQKGQRIGRIEWNYPRNTYVFNCSVGIGLLEPGSTDDIDQHISLENRSRRAWEKSEAKKREKEAAKKS